MNKTMLKTVTAGVAALALVALVPVSAPLAEEAADGKAIFMAQKCNMCHSVPSQGIEAKMKSPTMKGPDIAGIGTDADQITKFLKKEAEIDGKTHKKAFGGSDEELKTLVDWLKQQK